MRHESEDVAFAVTDSRDILQGTIWIRRWIQRALRRCITKNDLPVFVQPLERRSIRKETALAMGNGHSQKRSLRATVRKRRIRNLNPGRHHLANKVERTIPHQSSWEQSDFAKNLKSIANANHEFAVARFLNDAGHYRRKTGDCAAAKIIAVGKSARQHNRIESIDGSFLVPDVLSPQPRDAVQGGETILVTIRTGKLDNGEFHISPLNSSTLLHLVIFDHWIRKQVAAKSMKP